MAHHLTKKKRRVPRPQVEPTTEPDIEQGTPPRENQDERLHNADDVVPTLTYSQRTNSRDNLPGMSTYSNVQSIRRRYVGTDDTRSEEGDAFGNRSVDSMASFDQLAGSGRRESLARRPKEFRRPVDPEVLESEPDGDILDDSDSDIEEVSLNDEYDGQVDRNNASGSSFGANEVTVCRIRSKASGSFVSSWDSFAAKRMAHEVGEKQVTPRHSKPSHHSALRSVGGSMSSFQSGTLSRHLSISLRERDQMSVTSFLSFDEDLETAEGNDEVSDDDVKERPPVDKPEASKSRLREFFLWFDDWLRRKIQWIYVAATLYVGPICFAMYAPQIWVTALFYTSIACVTFVNAWMVCETFFSISYTRRMRMLHHIARPKLIGERRLGCIVCAYLPNELTVLIQTVRAISNTIYELPEGTTMDIVLSHNGGKKEQRISLLEDLRKIEGELPANVMVHELNVLSSRSKAENVNAALGFFTELGKIRGNEFTQFAMYDADHQPIPQAWRYALETMQDQGADMVMGRCCVADGIKTIAIEFDILYCIGHAGGRCVRGFGFFGGSNGYWDAKTLTETGMDEGMLTEDVDSSFRAQSVGHFMTYDPTIVSYEESPPNFSGLFKQRLRWAQGWYEVTLRQITLPFRRAPGLNPWSRFCLFLLLPFREIYVYLSSFTVPIAIVYLTSRCGWGCVDYRLLAFAAFCLLVPVTMTIMAWNITHDRYLNVHYRMPTLTPIDYIKYILVSYFYELFKIHLTVMGHVRQMLGLNKWVVTKRKGTSDRVAPTITPSLVLRTIPEMLIRHSPFARSTRQMFSGTFDEHREKPFEHHSTDIVPAIGNGTDDSTSSEGSLKDEAVGSRGGSSGKANVRRQRDDDDLRSSKLAPLPATGSAKAKPAQRPQSSAVGISMTGEIKAVRPMAR